MKIPSRAAMLKYGSPAMASSYADWLAQLSKGDAVTVIDFSTGDGATLAERAAQVMHRSERQISVCMLHPKTGAVLPLVIRFSPANGLDALGEDRRFASAYRCRLEPRENTATK